MDKKTIQNYRRRIQKAQSSLNAMGEMLLQMDIDNMVQFERIELRDALAASKSPVTYPYLNSKIERVASEGANMLGRTAPDEE